MLLTVREVLRAGDETSATEYICTYITTYNRVTRKQPVTSLLDFSCQLVYGVHAHTYYIVFVFYLFIL